MLSIYECVYSDRKASEYYKGVVCVEMCSHLDRAIIEQGWSHFRELLLIGLVPFLLFCLKRIQNASLFFGVKFSLNEICMVSKICSIEKPEHVQTHVCKYMYCHRGILNVLSQHGFSGTTLLMLDHDGGYHVSK